MLKIYLSQIEVDHLIDQLIEKVKGKKFLSVVGIANGGSYISKRIADALNVEHRLVKISHYDGTEFRSAPIVECDIPPITNSLICDDLIDGGSTLKTFNENFGLGTNEVAVLFWNINSYKPDYYVKKKPDVWLVFPWEII